MGLMIPIVALIIPIVAILVKHQQRMAEIISLQNSAPQPVVQDVQLREEMRLLREQVAALTLRVEGLSSTSLPASSATPPSIAQRLEQS